MSEYQRFVTYINLYEENSKVRNVGFAKIEKRGGQCKIEIHMRGTGYTGISCPVYFFVRNKEQMIGIAIGKIQIMNGTGEGRFLLDGENMNQSGYGLEDVSGFMILVSDKVMFASQWDEQEIRREQFVPLQEIQPQERAQKEEVQIQREEMQPKKEELQQKEEVKDTVEQPEVQAAGQSDKNRDGNAGKQPMANEQTIRATEAAVQLKTIQPQRKQPQRTAQNHSGAQWNAQENEPEWDLKWKFILEKYPVLTPFEGEEDTICIRIELKDLRLLPKRYWYLGNNSFLLHGFFNYRYLIMGCMEQEDRKKWFIGIPGVFQSQEKVMASIFGFPEYKSEKIAEQKTGQFGYWYRIIDL